MPVSGKTSPDEIPFLVAGDIPNMGAGDEAIAERVQAILKEEGRQPLSWLKSGTKKQIIVCNSSGVPQYVTASGDLTNDEAGVFSIGKEKITLEKLVAALGLTDAYIAAANKDGAVGTPSLRTLGTGSKQAAAGNDGRLSDERVPKDASATSRKVKPTTHQFEASADLALTTGYQDVPGTPFEVTPAVPSILLVTAVFELGISTGGVDPAEANFGNAFGTLSLDGVEQTKVARQRAGRGSANMRVYARGTVSQTYALSLTAAAHTLKLRAKYSVEGGTDSLIEKKCYGAGTGASAVLFAA